MELTQLTPITRLILLSGVKLDNTYTDSVDFFNSPTEQATYFMSKQAHSFTDFAPVRLQNQIKIPLNADAVYNCNYVMFQNRNFSNKWFYAFITKIDFENINMCSITIEIDIVQTWFFDYKIMDSFVEREHAETDKIGDNLVKENLETGEYVTQYFGNTGLMENKDIIIASAMQGDGVLSAGGIIGGIYSGIWYNVFQNAIDANTFIINMTEQNKSDAIVSVFMMPRGYIANSDQAISTTHSVPMENSRIGLYTPKNKKLLTYPYSFMHVINTEGSEIQYRFEYFGAIPELGYQFTIYSNTSPSPELVLVPFLYKYSSGGGLGGANNLNATISISGFPQCAFNIDTYKAWLAQNSTSVGLSVASGVLGTVGSLASGNVVGAIGGAVGIAQTLGQVAVASTMADSAKGTATSSAFFAHNLLDFHFYRMTITEEYAKIIDDYFSMYGYATHRVKTPNTKSRRYWNYLKTQDIKLVGNIPFNDISALKTIYNKGITLWHNDDVGNYNRNNTIV